MLIPLLHHRSQEKERCVFLTVLRPVWYETYRNKADIRILHNKKGENIMMIDGAIPKNVREELERRLRERSKTRKASELIELKDLHFDRFSDFEMGGLFIHLWVKHLGIAGYSNEPWQSLHDELVYRAIMLPVFNEPKTQKQNMADRELEQLFHRLWTQQGYDEAYHKMDWKVFHKQLILRGIFT